MSAETMCAEVLRLDQVTFSRAGVSIIDRIDLTVRTGEHWALLGPNGAGKSTILGFCGATRHPTSGTVEVLQQRLGRVELQALRRSIGHVDPRHALQGALTVREVVLTGLTGTIQSMLRWEPTAEQLVRADDLLEAVGLSRRVHAAWPTLSQGERGRALIARALISEPRLLLLDEPSTGLDVAAREQLMETIDRLVDTHPDLASVMVTHHLEELPASTNRALLIAHGRTVASGEAAEVITTEHISAAFEHPIEVEHRLGRWSARALRG